MSKPKPKKPSPDPLNPDVLYRKDEARPFFGYKPTQFEKKIKEGEIPAPIKLSDTGHACGWLGRTILEWQAERAKRSQAA
jgi:predicted DNA-binding transcriptional regulator AlpA